ncbi:MAG: acylneuraminate cytidylyltransferase family protein [Phascolarctobacterium sp.]|nr:acylneuraminate cytidylyltransferase family protein [Phascolarctobacterium sp.]
MKNIAIIPARSGSKGLPDKNIRVLNGHPLLYYSVKAAQESGLFSEIMVSTDSEVYAEVAKSCGASVPFLRSKENSNDGSSSWDVVKEVLSNYNSIGLEFDTVCLLQPTSPLRESKDIINAYELLNEKDADAITSVCECEHSPLWCMTLDNDHYLSEFRKSLADLPRQKLKQYYRFNGAIYIRKIEYIQNQVILLESKEYAYVMDRMGSVDIDTINDFKYAEYLLKNLFDDM